MTVRDIIIIAIAGLLLLGFLAVRNEKEPIEDLLRTETLNVFKEFDVDSLVVRVQFDGRDATLNGRVVSLDEKKRVEEVILDEVWGVRVVNNYLAVQEPVIIERPAPPVTATSDFRLTQVEGGVINVAGQVHDEPGRDLIVRTVRDAFPNSTVTDSLAISGEMEKPTWYSTVLALIPTVGLVESPLVEIDAGSSRIKLTGIVFGEQQRDAIMVDATQAIGAPFELEASIDIRQQVIVDENPEVAAVRKRIEELLRTTRIQFRINTAVLVPLSKQVLDDVYVVLKEMPDLQIEVQGHTDNTGSNAMNRRLSQARADAVRDYLIEKGLKAGNLTAIGYGPTRPVATNTTLEGRIMNRRVVFSLKGGS